MPSVSWVGKGQFWKEYRCEICRIGFNQQVAKQNGYFCPRCSTGLDLKRHRY